MGHDTRIERIATPAPADFARAYVHEQRPVVLTDLFRGQAVDQLRSLADALDAWGHVALHVQEEYAASGGAPQPPVTMALRDYVDHTRREPGTHLCCTEYETPARILAAFELPALCTGIVDDGPEVLGLPRKYGDLDLATNLFVANGGNVAHLHFDGDHRQVLLHQVYGRKRVLLLPPRAAVHLRTLDGPYARPSLAGVRPEDLDDDEQLALVERLGGHATVLEPGETLFIPMLLWHHVEYVEDAMSFNLRFGRTRYGRFLSLDQLHRDPFVQNVGATFRGSPEALDAAAPVMARITSTYLQDAPDRRAKVRAMRALFRELCHERCPEARPDELCPPDREEEQINRILESTDMAGGLKYAPPDVIARSRPVGPISDRQASIIDAGFRERGYPVDAVPRVLRNRVGKDDIGTLTKAEAALVIDYLTTPGATW